MAATLWLGNSSVLCGLTSPTYFCTSSEPMTLIKQASVLLATARAHRVFPVPGGPNSSTPFGGSIPRLTNLSGWWGEEKRKEVSMIGQRKTVFIPGHVMLQKEILKVSINQLRTFVKTHMQQGGLDHFSQLLNLLLTSTNIAVGHIRLLLHLQYNIWIKSHYYGWKRFLWKILQLHLIWRI